MTYPTSSTKLGKIIQPSDGGYTDTYTVPASGPYTHKLGTGLTPVQPSYWQNVPVGAFPISSPAIIPSSALVHSIAGFLPSLATYKYALSNVTDAGQTLPGPVYTVTLDALSNAVSLSLPPATQGTTDAPIRKRRLWRSLANGTALFFVAEIADLDLTTYLDGMADEFLGIAAPVTNTSGSVGSVVLSGAGKTWLEQAPGTSLTTTGWYIVDYSSLTTGGTITHAAVDAGVAGVTATFTAGTLATAPVMNDIIAAIQDVELALGTNPQGASSDLTARLVTLAASVANNGIDISSIFGTPNTGVTGHSAISLVTTVPLTAQPGTRAPIAAGGYFVVPVSGVASGDQGIGHNSGFDVLDLTQREVSPSLFYHIDMPLDGTTQMNPVAAMFKSGYLIVGTTDATIGCLIYDVAGAGSSTWSTKVGSLSSAAVCDLVDFGSHVGVLSQAAGLHLQVFPLSSLAYSLPAITPTKDFTLSATVGTGSRAISCCNGRNVIVSGGTGNTQSLFIVDTETVTSFILSDSMHLNTPGPMAAGGRYLYVGNTGATGTAANSIFIYDLQTGAPISTLLTAGINNPSALLVFGNYLVVANKGANSVGLYDLTSPTAPVLLETITGGISAPTALSIVDRHLLICNGGSSLVTVMDLNHVEMLAVRAGSISAGQLHSDGHLIVAGRTDTGSLSVGRGGMSVGGNVDLTGTISNHMRLLSAQFLNVDTTTGSGGSSSSPISGPFSTMSFQTTGGNILVRVTGAGSPVGGAGNQALSFGFSGSWFAGTQWLGAVREDSGKFDKNIALTKLLFNVPPGAHTLTSQIFASVAWQFLAGTAPWYDNLMVEVYEIGL